MSSKTIRFQLLDGLRGVAALCVALYHFGNSSSLPFAQHAYLAVDFFFILSGLVIAYAYEPRFQDNAISWTGFFKARLIRLYPMLLLGTLLGLIVAFVTVSGVATWRHVSALAAIAFALLLIPLGDPHSRWLYPINIPTWSLSDEIVVNLAYAGIAKFLTTRLLIVLCAVLTVALLLINIRFKTFAVGFWRGEWSIGLIRAACTFSYGVLIARAVRARRIESRVSNLMGWSLAAGLATALLMPVLHDNDRIVSAVLLFIGFPSLVILAAQVRCSGLTARLCALSGRLSYPLYLIHFPLVDALAVYCRTHGFGLGPSLGAAGAAIAASVALSWAALKVDEPVRAYLTSLLTRFGAQQTSSA